MTGSVRQPEMSADDVCDFLALMDAHGIRVWLDGGWAVRTAASRSGIVLTL